MLGPDQGHHGVVLGALDGRVTGLHTGHDLSVHEDLCALGQVPNTVDVGGPPHVVDTGQDGMFFEFRIHDAARAFPTVVTVVVDPSVSQDLLAEPPSPGSAVEAVVGVGTLLIAIVEGVGGGP